MRLFLDSSVLLAASGSASGASREIIRRAPANDWILITTPYVIEEALNNLASLPPKATSEWVRIRPVLVLMDDVFTLDRPVVFEACKDRPILFSALAWADILLTLDRRDFAMLLDKDFYGLPVLRPGTFFMRERSAGRLR